MHSRYKFKTNKFCLSNVKQWPNESLADFVRRFHQEVVLIPDLEDGVA